MDGSARQPNRLKESLTRNTVFGRLNIRCARDCRRWVGHGSRSIVRKDGCRVANKNSKGRRVGSEVSPGVSAGVGRLDFENLEPVLPRLVTLNNGARHDLAAATADWETLNDIGRKSPALLRAAYELANDHQQTPAVLRELRRVGFVLRDGTIREVVKNLLLSGGFQQDEQGRVFVGFPFRLDTEEERTAFEEAGRIVDRNIYRLFGGPPPQEPPGR